MSNENAIEIITAVLPLEAAKKWNRICDKYFPNTSNEFGTIITLMDEILKSNPEVESLLLRKSKVSHNSLLEENNNKRIRQ